MGAEQPIAGFFEFSMMRVRGDLDQKFLAELFHQYLDVGEEFIKALFADGETELGRAFVSETSLPPDGSLEVLDFERASLDSCSSAKTCSGQMGSRYLDKLIEWNERRPSTRLTTSVLSSQF